MKICLSGVAEKNKKDILNSLKLYDKQYKIFESLGFSNVKWFLYEKPDISCLFDSISNLFSKNYFISNYGLLDAYFYSINIDTNLHEYIKSLLDTYINEYNRVYYFNANYDVVSNIKDKEKLDCKVWELYNKNPNKIVFLSATNNQEKLDKIIQDLLSVF